MRARDAENLGGWPAEIAAYHTGDTARDKERERRQRERRVRRDFERDQTARRRPLRERAA